ncbi:MAG: hypothetical protein E6R04_08740 [Spirochaetes bacterium]|nr:MAG: hypothetical protein E6R04_08740 [Spirochaetota bacterium]
MKELEILLRLDDIEKRLEGLAEEHDSRIHELEKYCNSPRLVDGIEGFVVEFEEERHELGRDIKDLKERLETIDKNLKKLMDTNKKLKKLF